VENSSQGIFLEEGKKSLVVSALQSTDPDVGVGR